MADHLDRLWRHNFTNYLDVFTNVPVTWVNHLNQTYSGINMTKVDDLCSVSGGRNSTLCNQRSFEVTVAAPVSMFVTGVVGNILALIVLYTTSKEIRHTVFFVLLTGLAWSDLCSQIMTSPVAILIYANNLNWVGGKPLCIYHAFVMICFGLITPILVFVLSFERLLSLKFTYFYGRAITPKRTKLIVLACWIFVILFGCLPFVGLGSFEHQYPGSWCFLNFHHETPTDAAYAYLFAIVNIVLILCSVGINIAVVITLLIMRRRRHVTNRPSFSVTLTRHKKRLVMEMEIRMVWFLCAITTIFVICWLPLNVHIIMNLITGQIAYKRDLLFVRLASINQILDPWMYILLRRAALRKISRMVRTYVCCCCKRTPVEELSPYYCAYRTNQISHCAAYFNEKREQHVVESLNEDDGDDDRLVRQQDEERIQFPNSETPVFESRIPVTNQVAYLAESCLVSPEISSDDDSDVFLDSTQTCWIPSVRRNLPKLHEFCSITTASSPQRSISSQRDIILRDKLTLKRHVSLPAYIGLSTYENS